MSGGFTGFQTIWKQGASPVTQSSAGTAPPPPYEFVQGTKQLPHSYPADDFRAMQAELAAADPWKAGPDIVARRDAGGNTYFTDRNGRTIR